MEWDIPPKTRCDIIAFTGVNFSGHRYEVNIHPVGGLQGDDLDGEHVQSIAIVGRPATRVILKTTVAEKDWEERPWRCITVTAEAAYKTKEGKLAVRVPDLDWLDAPNAPRSDPDFQGSFDQVASLAKGTGWTFGRSGPPWLKDNIRAIKVENS